MVLRRGNGPDPLDRRQAAATPRTTAALPAEQGVGGLPTLINNVEAFRQRGARSAGRVSDWFNGSDRTTSSKGTQGVLN